MLCGKPQAIDLALEHKPYSSFRSLEIPYPLKSAFRELKQFLGVKFKTLENTKHKADNRLFGHGSGKITEYRYTSETQSGGNYRLLFPVGREHQKVPVPETLVSYRMVNFRGYKPCLLVSVLGGIQLRRGLVPPHRSVRYGKFPFLVIGSNCLYLRYGSAYAQKLSFAAVGLVRSKAEHAFLTLSQRRFQHFFLNLGEGVEVVKKKIFSRKIIMFFRQHRRP